jgi:hypothetical protein
MGTALNSTVAFKSALPKPSVIEEFLEMNAGVSMANY